MATLLKHFNFSNVVILGERDGVKVVLGERDRHGVKAPIVVKTYRTRTSATGKQLEYKYLHKAEVEARLLLHLHERVGDRADINIYCDEYLRSGLLYSSVSITMPCCPTLLSIYDRMCVVGDKVLPNATTCVIGLELIKEVQHLHEKGLCHGDLHAGNVLISKLAMVHRDARPCFRTLFANEEPDPPQPLEVRIIDFNMSFPFEKVDSSPFNENGHTGKPGAMFLHDDIKAAGYTVVDDVGSVYITYTNIRYVYVLYTHV
jgi:serine/threonine protein kinase